MPNVAKFAEAIYVLHAFIKKSRGTARRDIEIAASRYRKPLNLSDQWNNIPSQGLASRCSYNEHLD